MVVIPLGLEPKTVCLEGRCSIQLSYGTKRARGVGPRRLQRNDDSGVGAACSGEKCNVWPGMP